MSDGECHLLLGPRTLCEELSSHSASLQVSLAEGGGGGGTLEREDSEEHLGWDGSRPLSRRHALKAAPWKRRALFLIREDKLGPQENFCPAIYLLLVEADILPWTHHSPGVCPDFFPSRLPGFELLPNLESGSSWLRSLQSPKLQSSALVPTIAYTLEWQLPAQERITNTVHC